MDRFEVIKEINRATARYESGTEVPVRVGYVAVVNTDDSEPFFEKFVTDCFRLTPLLPKPFFERRLNRAATKAQKITDQLNAL